jgi:hypothetical protein
MQESGENVESGVSALPASTPRMSLRHLFF